MISELTILSFPENMFEEHTIINYFKSKSIHVSVKSFNTERWKHLKYWQEWDQHIKFFLFLVAKLYG